MRRVVLRQMFSGVSAFLAIGTRNARFYRDYDVSSERIFSAPYAVDNSFFSEQAKRLKGSTYRLRQREGIAVDRPLILFAGKLIQKKRPKDLLDAFDRVRTSIAVSLAFVGEGALRPELQRLARDKGIENVHFLGFRNQSEIGKCYAMADVLVLPSSLETWGLVVNEAMCFGLPVITSDRVGAAADLVREGVNGFVYPVGNTVELARCVRDILRDAARRAQMGRESHRLIEKWDLSATVEGISQALRFVTQSIVDS